MDNYVTEKNGFKISTNIKDVDYERLHHFLAKESYWAQNIPMEIMKKSISNSLNFSMIEVSTNKFVGFARLVTDRAVFAYLADVFIDTNYRGNGLGKWLVETIMNNPEVQGLRAWFLRTKDAQGLYAQFGWKTIENPENAMIIRKSAEELYKTL
jgi:N-acetylglutamate synthase-like GNAT family acetyltransferase